VSTRPRLLFVADRFLFPVDCGAKIRTTQTLRGLKGGRFEIVLLSPGTSELVERHATELAGLADSFHWWPENSRGSLFELMRLRHIPGRVPVSIATDRSSRGAALVGEQLARAPDVVVFDFLHSCILRPERLETPSVLFTHNIEAEIFRRHADVAANPVKRAIWRDQFRKMHAYEAGMLGCFDTVIAVSERDGAHFRKEYGASNVTVIGTGVDLDYFAWKREPQPGSIVFTGSMDWMANIDAIEFFMDEVWTKIVAAVPHATMTVVGRAPPASLTARAAERQLPWTFTGRVPDVRPYVHRGEAYVIPLRVGGGTRLKVFEAMSMGCPVVSTAIGVEGLAVEHGQHYLRADSAGDMADAVVRLLQEPAEGARIARAARKLVEEHASYRSIARDFERICAETLATRRPSSPAALACATSP
jgi:glycosyltransferase involved in cell wall biosynthesis